MAHDNDRKKTEKSDVKKQNQDFPNIPASTEKINSGDTAHKEIKKTSKLHNEGKTDNTKKNAEN